MDPKFVVEVDILDMLDVVCAAEGYGYADDVLMDAFGKWLKGKVTDEVIDALCRKTLDSAGYTQEDADERRGQLERFRDRWAS